MAGRIRFLSGSLIIKTIRLLSAAVLACASIAAQAQADDIATTHWKFGVQLGTVQDKNNTEPDVQATLAYDIDPTWAVEGVVNASALFIRIGGLKEGDREFDDAFGVRVKATLPVSERWSLVGGLGVVRFDDEIGHSTDFFSDNEKRHKVSPMVSLAAMYRLGRRWSLGAEVSSFTAASTVNAGLRAEFHF